MDRAKWQTCCPGSLSVESSSSETFLSWPLTCILYFCLVAMETDKCHFSPVSELKLNDGSKAPLGAIRIKGRENTWFVREHRALRAVSKSGECQ